MQSMKLFGLSLCVSMAVTTPALTQDCFRRAESLVGPRPGADSAVPAGGVEVMYLADSLASAFWDANMRFRPGRRPWLNFHAFDLDRLGPPVFGAWVNTLRDEIRDSSRAVQVADALAFILIGAQGEVPRVFAQYIYRAWRLPAGPILPLLGGSQAYERSVVLYAMELSERTQQAVAALVWYFCDYADRASGLALRPGWHDYQRPLTGQEQATINALSDLISNSPDSLRVPRLRDLLAPGHPLLPWLSRAYPDW